MEFPESVKGTYTVMNKSIYEKDLLLKMEIPIIKQTVGKFLIPITLGYDKKIQNIDYPCMYIGAPN